MNMANAKFDIKTEAARGLYAGAGIADLAVEAVKEYVADAQKRLTEVQKSFADFDLNDLSKEAQARRTQIEKRVAELQDEAQKLPQLVQALVNENVETANETYDDLVKRGETVVRKFRNKPATKQTVANAKTTVAKAKTTRTQATKAAKSADVSVKAPSKRKTSTAKSSAKATGTAAKKTARSAAKAVR
jgi:heparin binding hemagglutinin HbhA